MNRLVTTIQAVLPVKSHGEMDMRLCGAWLVLARTAWVVVALLTLGLVIAGIPAAYAQWQIPCAAATMCASPQPTLAMAQDLHRLGWTLHWYATYYVVLATVAALVNAGIAFILFWRRSDDRMALFGAITLVTNGGTTVGTMYALASVVPVFHLPVATLYFIGQVCILVFFSLFPDGRFVPRWTVMCVLIYTVLWAMAIFFSSSSSTAPPRVEGAVGGALNLAIVGSVVVAQVYRYRRVSTPTQRQQTKWVVFGLATAIVGFLIAVLFQVTQPSAIMSSLITNTAITAFLLLIPISIGIAILRSRLYDIDIIINRALVYGLLSACVIALYVLVVVSLSMLLQSSGNLLISLLATSLVAVLFQPLRLRLQRAVNRLMYGERDEPYAVVTRLSQRLEGTLAPEAVLPTIVETVARALKLPYVAISLQQDDASAVVASYGKPIDNPLILSLTYQGETVGQLLLAARTPGEAFTAGDRRLLDELARHAGLAAHAVRLTADLQRSRERLVTAREEERRRLRRDLHDGLGSALTSAMFKMDATDEMIDRDPVTARALLAEVRAQTQASIDDIRRLVYNLRPPILDEWGLMAALHEHVAQYNLNNVRVSIDAPLSLPPLPAAVEVAVYRMVLEALANVIKHAQATTCTIRLHLMDDALTVEVQDDGLGRRASCHAGVGVTAMRERAEELGGWCVVEDAAPHGTRVFARFPVRKE